jgi:hypothetical protein
MWNLTRFGKTKSWVVWWWISQEYLLFTSFAFLGFRVSGKSFFHSGPQVIIEEPQSPKVEKTQQKVTFILENLCRMWEPPLEKVQKGHSGFKPWFSFYALGNWEAPVIYITWVHLIQSPVLDSEILFILGWFFVSFSLLAPDVWPDWTLELKVLKHLVTNPMLVATESSRLKNWFYHWIPMSTYKEKRFCLHWLPHICEGTTPEDRTYGVNLKSVHCK